MNSLLVWQIGWPCGLVAWYDELRSKCGCHAGKVTMCDACAAAVLKRVMVPVAEELRIVAQAQLDDAPIGEPLRGEELQVISSYDFGWCRYGESVLRVFPSHELTIAARHTVAAPGITIHITDTTFPDPGFSYLENTS